MLTCGITAQATNTINMAWVPVGNAGNNADDTGYGSVGYIYQIGKYEVTSSQYCDFLNAVGVTDASDPHGLYNLLMDTDDKGCKIYWNSTKFDVRSGYENKPVNYVSWYDCLRFANWMHNGQGQGETEDGAYDMSLGSNVIRKAEALIWLPSEDEWYKAAYYKGGGTNAGYWEYATQSDTTPNNNWPNDDNGNSANYGHKSSSPYITDVDAYVLSTSAYGTLNQNGNIVETLETLTEPGSFCHRGAAWSNTDYYLSSFVRASNGLTYECSAAGLRIARIPEPATVLLLGLGGLLLKRKRKK